MQKKAKALLVGTGVAALFAGALLMNSFPANAADNSGTGSSSSSTRTSSPGHSNGNSDPTKPMRDDEQLLTGDTLAKVTAAVKAKYPDATFQRVETDSDGVYEAHVLVDGKPVTVEVDKSFAITGTESARSGGARKGEASNGEAPAA